MATMDRRLATEAEAKVLASAIRLRILRLCLDEPRTNQEIAARLSANPASTLHHVRKLVATGFLTPQHPRRGPRGAREIPYLATRKSWQLSVPGSGQVLIDALLAEYRRVGDPSELEMTRLGLWLTEAEYQHLVSRIHDLLEELAAKPRDPSGRPYSLFFSLHPDVDREPEGRHGREGARTTPTRRVAGETGG